MQLNGASLIRLPPEDSKDNYLDGFWRWVSILAEADYQRALESLYWPTGTDWTPEVFSERITTFFGGSEPWYVVVPNERLIGVINDGAQHDTEGRGDGGWLMAQIPLTTEPDDPKRDDIPLMGLAASFFVRDYEGSYVFEFEIFHL